MRILSVLYLYNNKCFVRHNLAPDGPIRDLLGFLEPLWVPYEEFMGGVKEYQLIKQIFKKKLF